MGSESSRIPSGQKGYTSGRTHRADVMMVQLYSVCDEPIDVGSSYERAVIAYVCPAEIISQDKEYVWFFHLIFCQWFVVRCIGKIPTIAGT